ncbi:nucleotidyltransferase family protein [Geminocystis herdmanii]|uniref:nucleotidyltransferase family protein n=1 Tax=Geminocystis herdmanii TaxID=669359 RepID=UPI00037F7F17|nr:nucleotidyltransferase family protein [Geminocystis herdmanii]
MNNLLTEKQQTLTKEIILQTLKNQENFFVKYDIKTLALFGSTARNEATENSDLDFLVEFNHSTTLDGYMNLKFYLEELFNKSVDLVTFKSIKTIIKNSVLAEAIYVEKP